MADLLNIALINASPKPKDSASALLLADLKQFLAGADVTEIALRKPSVSAETIRALRGAQSWVIACPLYVDGLPGHLLSCLEQLEPETAPGTRVYGLMNCGFPEGIQNETALRMMANWCARAGALWCGGIGVGAGGSLSAFASLGPLSGPKAPVGKALRQMAGSILSCAAQENLYPSVGLPRPIYSAAAHFNWIQRIRANGGQPKDLTARPETLLPVRSGTAIPTAVTAHSGCEGTPDNSMESILVGIGSGAECIEVDVQIDSEGRLWLTHDMREEYSGTVSLREAFEAVMHSRVSINCDLKDYRALYPVIALADEMGLPREKFIFSGSVDASLLEKDPSIARRARIFLNTEELCKFMAEPVPQDREGEMRFFDEQLDQIADFVHKTGVEAINAPYHYVTKQQIAAMRIRGIGLSLWTVNESEDIEDLLQAGLLSLTTRRPAEAVRIRRELQAKA